MLIRDPIYQQLNQQLRELLARSADGERFLTEREVSARYQVSRTTANKALASLVTEGLLEFRKGVGTFVKGARLHLDLERLVSFTSKARSVGKKPATRVITFRKIASGDLPQAVAVALGVGAGESAFFFERVRSADDVPVIVERRYIPVRACPGLQRADVKGSLYDALTTRHHIAFGSAEQTIRAVNLTAGDASLLALPPGTAALVVTAVATTKDGQPLWYEETTYASNAYVFRNHIGTTGAPTPAYGQLVRRTGE
jgi:GntR family transcriptional regulator